MVMIIAHSIYRAARRRNHPMKALLRNLHHPIGGVRHRGSASSLSVGVRQYSHTDSLVGEDGYLQFETLHELCNNATAVYENNPLFGTFASTQDSLVALLCLSRSGSLMGSPAQKCFTNLGPFPPEAIE